MWLLLLQLLAEKIQVFKLGVCNKILKASWLISVVKNYSDSWKDFTSEVECILYIRRYTNHLSLCCAAEVPLLFLWLH